MPLGQIRIDDADFPPEPTTCLRCGATAPMRFAGACPACTAELRSRIRNEAKAVEADYVPKANVTVNAVALKDD